MPDRIVTSKIWHIRDRWLILTSINEGKENGRKFDTKISDKGIEALVLKAVGPQLQQRSNKNSLQDELNRLFSYVGSVTHSDVVGADDRNHHRIIPVLSG